jgi:hypothetical protein
MGASSRSTRNDSLSLTANGTGTNLDKDERQGFKDRLLVEDFENENGDTRRGDQVIFTRPSGVKVFNRALLAKPPQAPYFG